MARSAKISKPSRFPSLENLDFLRFLLTDTLNETLLLGDLVMLYMSIAANDEIKGLSVSSARERVQALALKDLRIRTSILIHMKCRVSREQGACTAWSAEDCALFTKWFNAGAPNPHFWMSPTTIPLHLHRVMENRA